MRDQFSGAKLRRVYFILYALYLIVGLLARWQGWVHVDEIWFVDAARHILDGSWHIYDFKSSPDIAPPDGLAYSYSPLPALIMAPFVWIGDALGKTQADKDSFSAFAIAIPLMIADILAMEQMRSLVRQWRPRADERAILLGVAATLFLTGFIVVSAYRGHQEGLVLLFLLLTLRFTPRNIWLGGLMAGLTLAAKHTSVLELAAIGAVLLWPAFASKRRSEAIKRAASWTACAVGVFALFMLPPLIASRAAVSYAFVTQEQRRVLLGPGLPAWIDRGFQAALEPGANFDFWHGVLLRYSNAALIIIFAFALALALWNSYRHQRPIGLIDSRLLALVALGGLLQIVLAKWVSGHYYQLPLALALLWGTVQTAPRLSLTGLGGGIAFRSATQLDFPNTPPLRDAAILGVFVWLALVAGVSAFGDEEVDA